MSLAGAGIQATRPDPDCALVGDVQAWFRVYDVKTGDPIEPADGDGLYLTLN